MAGLSKTLTAGRFCRRRIEGSQEACARRARAPAYGWNKYDFIIPGRFLSYRKIEGAPKAGARRVRAAAFWLE